MVQKAPPGAGAAALAAGGAVLVACSSAAAFHPGLYGSWDFVWDDTANFSPEMASRLHCSTENLRWWLQATVLRVYEPVALALKAAVADGAGGLTPLGLHRAAVFSHSVCAVAAFLGTSQVLRVASPHWFGLSASDQLLAAVVGSLIFAVHPLNVQAVCWVSCLPYLWAATFCWCSIAAYSVAVTSSREAQSFSGLLVRSLPWTCLAAAFFLSAAFSKAVALPLPLLLFLVRWYTSMTGSDHRSSWRVAALVPDLPVWLGGGLAFSAAAKAALGSTLTTEVESIAVQLPLFENFLRASVSVFLYLAAAAVPDSGAAPFWPVSSSELSGPELRAGLAAAGRLLAVSLAATFLFARSYKFPCCGAISGLWLSFLLLISPCLQLLVQHGDLVWRADRYAYLPMALLLPPFLAAVFLAGTRALPRWAVLAGLVPLATLLGQSSAAHCERWRSGVSLWSAAAEALPDWAEFHHQLGVSLMQAGDREKAEEALRRAWDLRKDPVTAKALGHVEGLVSPARGLKWLQKALDLAERAAAAAREKNGSSTSGLVGLSDPQLASLYHDIAALTARIPGSKTERVAELYCQALKFDPTRALTQESCGLALAVAGKHKEAKKHLLKAKNLGRETAELHNGLGAIYYALDQLKDAEASFTEAVRLRPDWEDAASNLKAVKKARSPR